MKPAIPFVLVLGVAALGADLGCSAASGVASMEAAHKGSPGSHVGVHGMVLFGTEKIYASHIPTFGAPHNFQGVVEIGIDSGVPTASQSFSDDLYTIRPSSMSLYDLLHGTLTSFTGTIYRGNFESGGRPLFRNVRFAVRRVVLERALSPSTPPAAEPQYLAIGTSTDAYLVHLLDAPTTFDYVVGIESGSGLTNAQLESGVVMAVDGDNTVTSRLRRGDVAIAHPEGGGDESSPDAGEAGDAGTTDGGLPATLELRVRREYSCLTGPDFFEACR